MKAICLGFAGFVLISFIRAEEVYAQSPLKKLPEGHEVTVTIIREKKEKPAEKKVPGTKPEARKPSDILTTPPPVKDTIKEDKVAGETITGRVSSTDNRLISGAEISVEIGGKSFRARSSGDGGYRLTIPENIQVPDQLIIRADKEGYNTATRGVRKEEFQRADIKLTRVSENVIQIDRSLHHLGDGNYKGAINSQFQKPQAEAASYTKEFHLPEERLGDSAAVSVKLKMTVKGAQRENPILINGKKAGVLNVSNPDGSATDVEIDIDPCAFKPGENSLTLRSSATEASGDIDDFEFANIQLVFEPGKEFSPGDKGLAEVSSLRVMDSGFTQGIKEVSLGGNFSIEAKGKGRCGNLRDVALAEVFPKSKGEDSAIRVKLIETGPDTSVFRSRSSIGVAGFGVKAGDKIVVRAGVRGASVLVKGKKINLEGVWESHDPDNRYQMRVRFNKAKNKYEGFLTKQGKKFKEVGFSIGERIWSARPAEDWSFVATAQKWRWGSGGESYRSEWKSTGLDVDKSADDRLVLADGRVFTRVGPLAGGGKQAGSSLRESPEKPSKGTEAGAKPREKVSGRIGEGPKRDLTEKSAQTPQKGSAGSSARQAREKASPGTIPIRIGSRKLKAGIPVKSGPPSKEKRCASLKALKKRIEGGERPRLFERVYESPNGKTFKMIEASEEPQLKPSGYRETIVRSFIIFREAKKALEGLVKSLQCP
ncbi:MAG: carboxypeptidase-like regulatory domain-containing protein [Candidatus Binatia bacterium]